MRSLMPWVCLAAAAMVQAAFANDGITTYRQGNYTKAAELLRQDSGKDPVIDYYLGRMRLYGYGELKNNALAFDYFKQAGEKGFVPAQNILARYTLFAEHNPQQALYWFKKAANADDVQAQMYCAAAYLFGIGVKKNPEAARKYYIAAAKNGNSIAQSALAENFIASRHAENRKLGLIWLNKAVEQNNPVAQLQLGELYAAGKMVERDMDKAKEWIDRAIKQGYIPAMFQRGEIALQQNDVALAKDWYSKAAEKDYIPAQIALANLYLQPKNSLYDPQKGFLWMLKAAEDGSREARLALAKLYKEGQVVAKNENLVKQWQQKANEAEHDSLKVAERKAAQWLTGGKAFTLAASGYHMRGILTPWQNPNALKENNYNQAPQMNIINRAMLYKPRFVMIDPDEIAINEYYDALANSLSSKKITADNVFPQYTLEQFKISLPKEEVAADPLLEKPLVSIDSIGQSTAAQSPLAPNRDEPETQVNVNHFKLVSLPESSLDRSLFDEIFERAVLGNSTAQLIVAEMFQQGKGVQKNIEEAIKYYQLAAEQKDLRAEYSLGLLYLEGKEIPADYQKAMMWLQDAAFKGNPYAQYTLGLIQQQGYRDQSGKEVIQPNPEQGLAMLYLASSNNYSPAQYRLAETLVRTPLNDISVAAKEKRNQLIKRLYGGAVAGGVKEAALPLAFFNAMDKDPKKQSQALVVATKEAKEGNGHAALLLGLLYDRGIATAMDKDEALKWYQQASLNPVSAFILGTYYSQGKGIRKDIEKGKVLLQQAADGNFSYADLNLAVLKQHQGEAFLSDLERAHTRGNSTAGLLLADYFLSLANDQQKMKKARDLYQQLAEKGDKEAELKLAYMFEHGLGGNIDFASAQQWYTKSAEQQQPVAQYLLAHLYQLGEVGSAPDYNEAKKWYKAAEVAFAPAAVALGFIYETVDDDYAKAALQYQLAAQKQDPIGLFNLGLIYEKGKGLPVDFAKAKALYLQAAKEGHSQAMVQLAGMDLSGLGGSRKPAEALYWYKKAAAMGDRNALYQLGLLSETGVATDLNYQEALKYYQAAALKKNAKAMLALARMYQYGLGVQENKAEALKIYKELAAMNNPYAQYQLATLYYEGVNGERSSKEGKRLLQQAEKNGSSQARRALQWLEAQSQTRLSYLEPAEINQIPMTKQPAELLYLDALNEWNRGDEASSLKMLDRIRQQFPKYGPAKRAYEQLHQPLAPEIFS